MLLKWIPRSKQRSSNSPWPTQQAFFSSVVRLEGISSDPLLQAGGQSRLLLLVFFLDEERIWLKSCWFLCESQEIISNWRVAFLVAFHGLDDLKAELMAADALRIHLGLLVRRSVERGGHGGSTRKAPQKGTTGASFFRFFRSKFLGWGVFWGSLFSSATFWLSKKILYRHERQKCRMTQSRESHWGNFCQALGTLSEGKHGDITNPQSIQKRFHLTMEDIRKQAPCDLVCQ